MVDVRKPIAVEMVPDRPSDFCEGLDAVHGQVMVGLPNQKEPVSAPRHVANNWAGQTRNADRNAMGRSVARDIVDRNPTIGMEHR